MAARAMWTGSVAFGLVNVPVKMFTANRDQSIHFNQINSTTGNRVRQKRVDDKTGAEVKFDEIVKGYEIAPDRYVVIDPKELEGVAPKQTKQIVLERFVDPSELDVLSFESNYYLGPNAGGGKAYQLLVKALTDSGRVGIGRVVLRTSEHLAALRARDGVLVCTTLRFADEIVAPDGIAELDGPAAEASDAEAKMAGALVEALTDDFDHAAMRDEYREKVLAMINAKSAGEALPKAPDEPSHAVPDLMAALEASIEASGPPKKKPGKTVPTGKTKAVA